MMKIAVISDTHSQSIPKEVIRNLQMVNMVIHAGDICDMQIWRQIQKTNNVEAVYGNMDESCLRQKLPRRLILNCEGVKIGVFHGEGAPDGLIDRVRNEFKDDDVDVIVFGHSHEPLNQRIEGILLFNPGSPNDKIFAPYCSYGLLEINGDSVKAKIIKVD